MPPQHGRRILLFLLLLPLALFLFLSLPRSLPASSLPYLDANRKPSNFTLLIKVLTFNRPHSLRRCLSSLAAASYPSSDAIQLHIFVDHFRDGEEVKAADRDRFLSVSREVLEIADGFEWVHGEKRVHYRTVNAGLQGQWIESWWPGGDDEFAFVVEDDIEVSPMYYQFLKGAVARYYYEAENYNPSVFGVTLQRPRFVAGKHGNKIKLNGDNRIFLYQMVGTWGQLLFPRPWKEFRLWYDDKKAKGIKPFLQGMVTTGWYKMRGERIWTPWFIKFIHARGYYNIYTNFLEERALSISHRDAGVNYGKDVGPDSILIDARNLDFNLMEMPPLRELKWYDFCFSEVHPGKTPRIFSELGSILKAVQKQKIIVFISLFSTERKMTRNLICHLEKVGMQGYIFVGDDSEFLGDLARRGHPVIDASLLLGSISSNAEPLDDSAKEIYIKSQVIEKSLEMGYSSWLIEGNMVLLSSGLKEPSNPSADIFLNEQMELLFVRSSQNCLKTWKERLMPSLTKTLRSVSSNFLHAIVKSLDDAEGEAKVGKLENAVILLVDNLNTTSPMQGTDLVLWHHSVESALVQRYLESTDLWLIDADYSCNAVICHSR